MIIVKGELKGFDELRKTLDQLPIKVEKRILQGAVTAAMREARKSIKAVAPAHIDEQSPASKKYGTLKKNLRVVRLKRVRQWEKGARVDTGNAFWGYIYELGSRYQAARPWFAPAFQRASEEVLNVLRTRLGQGIEKIAQEK